MSSRIIAALVCLAAVAQAWDAPNYGGYGKIWQETFAGSSGTLPNEGNWNIIQRDNNANGELESYRRDTRNVQLSGGNTLQLVPWQDGSAPGGWTSGRLESTYVFTPADGEVTRVEAQIRFGGNSMGNKQGLWPAFWMLGDSIRHGTGWPMCGELDIMERIDGQLIGHGTMHCDQYPGGICNEHNGIGSAVQIPDQGWHTWRLEWNLRPGNWRDESITWYMDGQLFQTITGARIGDQGVWNSVAHSNVYFIVNMAVGGGWPGYPNSATQGGYGAMLETAYVAHYQT